MGENPPYGASINYYLKTAETAPVKISILDDKGQTIRTLDGPKDRGINKVWWDLEYELSKEIRLRTSPLSAPWVEVGSHGWRPFPGMGGGRMAVKAPSGRYTVRLSVGEKGFNQELIVKKDPHTAGSEEDIQAQTKQLLEIRENVNSVVDMINQLEWIRKQIYELKALLLEDKGKESIIATGEELDDKIISVENNLCQMTITGRGQDTSRESSKLVTRLLTLSGSISSADFPPTAQQIELHEVFKNQLKNYQNQFNELMKKDLPAFNNLLKEKNIPHTITIKTP